MPQLPVARSHGLEHSRIVVRTHRVEHHNSSLPGTTKRLCRHRPHRTVGVFPGEATDHSDRLITQA